MSRRGRSPPPRPQKSTVSVGRARHAALTDGQDVERAKERVRKRKKAAQEQEASSQGSKASKWDQAPAGFEGMTVGEVAARAPRLLSLPISSSIVNPNQLRQARRLYVGNIPTKVLSEEALLKFFNTAMVAAGKTGIGERPPVVAAQVNADKGYAFLEFEHSKICTECMLFDGIILEGNTLKLRRPKDYLPLPDTYAEEGVLPARERRGAANVSDLVPGLCSTTVPDSPYKLFAGALPNHLTEEQVKELLCSFGALRGFNMVRDKAKGSYAFFEYADHTVTDQAVAALHGMKIGDKSLIVQRSSSGGPASSAAVVPSDAAAAHPGAAACLSLQIPLVSILQSLPDIDRNAEPSSMLVLVNLFRPKDLATEEDYMDALAEVRGEMEQHGKLLDLQIIRPRSEPDPATAQLEGTKAADLWQPGNCGFTFCQYQTLAEAQSAQRAIQGRRFNGRFIVSFLAPRRVAAGQ